MLIDGFLISCCGVHEKRSKETKKIIQLLYFIAFVFREYNFKSHFAIKYR